jgi:hypothetical protein
MISKEKYLKYKLKYINLKNKIRLMKGGLDSSDESDFDEWDIDVPVIGNSLATSADKPIDIPMDIPADKPIDILADKPITRYPPIYLQPSDAEWIKFKSNYPNIFSIAGIYPKYNLTLRCMKHTQASGLKLKREDAERNKLTLHQTIAFCTKCANKRATDSCIPLAYTNMSYYIGDLENILERLGNISLEGQLIPVIFPRNDGILVEKSRDTYIEGTKPTEIHVNFTQDHLYSLFNKINGWLIHFENETIDNKKNTVTIKHSLMIQYFNILCEVTALFTAIDKMKLKSTEGGIKIIDLVKKSTAYDKQRELLALKKERAGYTTAGHILDSTPEEDRAAETRRLKEIINRQIEYAIKIIGTSKIGSPEFIKAHEELRNARDKYKILENLDKHIGKYTSKFSPEYKQYRKELNDIIVSISHIEDFAYLHRILLKY